MIFLKLGGSLITDKANPETARIPTINRMANELADFRKSHPDEPMLLGHGSGSFGHVEAAKYHTERGAATSTDWQGFTKVWHSAQRLNRLVVDSMHSENLPVINFSPSASARCQDGLLVDLSHEPIHSALLKGLIPIVHGDVAFDQQRGCTILSTEQVFTFLAKSLQPDLILLAGNEAGVYGDPADTSSLLSEIRAADLHSLSLRGTNGTDVTGGMFSKVNEALQMIQLCPGAKIYIFSPIEPGSLTAALEGNPSGTRVLA